MFQRATNILLCFLLLQHIGYAQSKLKFNFELAVVGNRMHFKDIPFSPLLYDTLGQLKPPQTVITSQTPFAWAGSVGFGCDYRVSSKIQIGISSSLFFRRLLRNNQQAMISYIGIVPTIKLFLINKLPNLYFLGGLRADYMLDVDNLMAVPITEYFYKQWEISPMVGVGYDWNKLPLPLQTAIQFNQGFKNLVADNPWQATTNYKSSAYFQAIWLNFSIGLGKKRNNKFD
jgi:hypothetical protein